MEKCENHDNWCECEKRGCRGCFHNKETIIKIEYKDNREEKEIINILETRLEKARNYIESTKTFRDFNKDTYITFYSVVLLNILNGKYEKEI